MPTEPSNPSWIEPPPKSGEGMGCFGKGCLFLITVTVLILLAAGISSYLFVSRGSKPKPIPVEELSRTQLAEVHQRIDQFEAAPTIPSYTPAPTSAETKLAGEETPAPAAPTPPQGRELALSAAEINGLISANRKSRGHAYVSLSGNTATVQVSVPADKVPGFPKGYVNGSFVITTDGPTSISALQVSKIQANGFSMPSGILSMSVGGHSVLSYALDQAASYNVSTAEVRNGVVVLH